MKVIYQCRLCGERYCRHSAVAMEVAKRCMVELNVGLVSLAPMAPRMTETHHCGGAHAGSLGLADFQGWEPEEEDG